MPRSSRKVDLTEVATFACVGLTAMAVHFALAISAIELLVVPVWFANLLGYMVAVPVSYIGHSIFTFSAKRYGRRGPLTGRSTRRFLLVSVSGFALNEVCVLLLIYQFAVPHRLALFATLVVVAGLLYLSSKFWAYPGKRPAIAPAKGLDMAPLKPAPAASHP